MRIVVFGGSGFVGSHVADALSDAGHRVVIFDRRVSPYLRPDQEMVVGDILDAEGVRQAVSGCQVAYHFAGLADIGEALERPLDTVRLNILGTVTVLEAARRADVGRFVFASTVYVYSRAGGFYRTSKQACESYIEEYHRQHGLDYTILRYGSLYGRRADSKNSVHNFLYRAFKERKVSYYGSGEEIREYIHVQDAARCSVDILAEDYRNQHVILTGHHPMKVSELMTMIQEIVGSDVEIEYQHRMSSDHAHYRITPYSFQPKLGRKLVRPYYLDMGQGLLDCLEGIYNEEMYAGEAGRDGGNGRRSPAARPLRAAGVKTG